MRKTKLEPAVREAFTLTELLVVLAVVALLALVAGKALAHSQTSSDRSVCASNLRRLMQAWQMYADDYSGALMANPSPPVANYLSWVRGVLDFNPANADNVNTSYLTNTQYAAMGFYVKSPALFRCPADLFAVIGSGVPYLRVRSYSMNSYVGLGGSAWSLGFQVMTNMSQVPQPDRTFVLLEEHPDSLNDGAFISDPARVGASATWMDFPAYFHLGGANLGLADGHVEYWQWADARTMPPVRFTGTIGNVSVPNDPDVARLQKITSYRP
jgi:prepilin-type N-terminal cleavage/methylation domain-containing protein/prepilin-type processing-associated H-X9-DG protein